MKNHAKLITFFAIIFSMFVYPSGDIGLADDSVFIDRSADFLGINRNTLNKKVKDYNVEARE